MLGCLYLHRGMPVSAFPPPGALPCSLLVTVKPKLAVFGKSVTLPSAAAKIAARYRRVTSALVSDVAKSMNC